MTRPVLVTPLLRHERVVATPQVGVFTGASVRRATAQAVENLLSVLAEVRT
jgi:D-3-phosphoglycerate dehydrogenase / 2-oxoglutarate reductase